MGSEDLDGRAASHCRKPSMLEHSPAKTCSLPATYTCDASGVWRSEELGTALPSCRPGTRGREVHGEGCRDVWEGAACLTSAPGHGQRPSFMVADVMGCSYLTIATYGKKGDSVRGQGSSTLSNLGCI